MDQDGRHRPGIIFGNSEEVEVLEFDYKAHIEKLEKARLEAEEKKR